MASPAPSVPESQSLTAAPPASLRIQQPGSHYDHLVRQTRVHHHQLSVMADTKANMLLTISSLVLTLSIPLVIDTSLRWTGLVLIVSAAITILLASYAVMPKHISGKLDPEDPGNDPHNMLFFGHFVSIPYEQYEAMWERLLNDPALTYQTQIKEIYGLGQYLAAYKYKYLRMAYFSFLGGLLIATATATATLYLSLQ